MKFRRIVPVLVLLAALLGLGPRAAAAAPILFDFNTLAAGVNSAAGADPIDTYMTATYGSAVTVNLGAKTLTGTPEAGHPAATELYLGNSDGAPDRGPLAGSPYAHPSPPDTYLINRWNATSLPANVRDRIVITFVTTPITSVEFDWEIFPQNGSGDADLTVKADGNPIFFAALTTSAEKLLGDLGHVGPVTFTTPVHTLEFIDWTTAPDGLDNLRVTPAAGPSPVPAPGTGLLLGVGLAGLAALRPGFRGAMTPLARRPGGPADALRP